MLTKDEHFEIEDKSGFPRCVPKTAEAKSAYKTLQFQLVKLAQQAPGATPPAIDGVIGPSTVLAVQVIAAKLAEGGYPALNELAFAQPEEAIPYVGCNAMEIAGAFEQVMGANPTALSRPQVLGAAEPSSSDPVQMLKGLLTVPRLAAAGVAVAGITGIALAAYASDRRGSGQADRSSFLPESDGSDDFYEEVDEGSDDDHGDHAESREQDGPQSFDESAHAA